ncbi:MAG: Crp/Fnr family transcriptional regulator [Pseudomonadota bacterium]
MNISDFSIFRNLPGVESQNLDKLSRQMNFRSGDIIISSGSRINFVYFIISGRVKDSICTPAGKEVVFEILSSGDSFGLITPHGPQNSRSDFIAMSDCHLFSLGSSHFLNLMKTHPSVSQSVSAEFATLVSRLSDKLYELRAMDVSKRTGAEILRHVSSTESTPEYPYVTIDNLPTHEEIANKIFTHREAVTKEISRFKKAGILVENASHRLMANVFLLQKLVSGTS